MPWKLITLKHFPIFSRSWTNKGFFHEMKDSLGMNFTKYKNFYNGTYYDEDEFNKLKPFLISKLKKDINSIFQICKNWERDCNDLIGFTGKLLDTDFKNSSDEELITLVEKCVMKLRKTTSYIYLSVVFDGYFQDWLNKILEEKVKDGKKRMLYFQILTSPTKTTGLVRAKEELMEIAKVVEKEGPDKAEDIIKKYTKKFRWLGYDTAIGKDLTIEETKSKITSILRQKEKKPDGINRDDITNELNFTEKDKQSLELISTLIYLRTYRTESNMIAGSNMRPLIEEIAVRLNTNYENITQLTLNEIKDAVSSKRIDIDEIERRKSKCGVLMIDGKNRIYSGDDVDKIEEKLEVPKDLTELKGLVANQGNVRGHVKIVLNHKDFEKIEFGDILVTKMTNPDFIVVLEKCSGIITDIGGITCHAAVIARELNKPCITGTKYATKILKDEDLVEFDTDKGVVKKLK